MKFQALAARVAVTCTLLAVADSFETAAAGTDRAKAPRSPRTAIEMDAVDLCSQASWWPDSHIPSQHGGRCGDSYFFGDYRDQGWFSLLDRGLFRSSHVRATSIVPQAPSATGGLAVQILNHVLVVYAFDEDGIGVALPGDLGDLGPEPSFLEGPILARIAYGNPFEVSVRTTMRAHAIEVRQGGQVVLSTVVEKSVPHPDPFTYWSYFQDWLGTAGTIEWGSLAVSFKGLNYTGSVSPFPSTPYYGALYLNRIRDGLVVYRGLPN